MPVICPLGLLQAEGGGGKGGEGRVAAYRANVKHGLGLWNICYLNTRLVRFEGRPSFDHEKITPLT